MIQAAEGLSQSALPTKRIMHYVFSHQNFLGKGNFSVVYSGINEQTNLPVAIKVQDLSSLDSPKILELHRSELDVLSKLSHPNVIKCYDILEEEKCCYIVTELCQEGDLDMYVKKKGVLDEETVAPLLRDILEGLLYLEQLHIVHRDIKVANVFLSGQTAKIADFGFAVFAKDNFKDANIGSPLYMSPEGFKHSIYGPKTDVWAFGALVFELLHGDTPYASCILEKQLLRQLSIPFNRTKVRPSISPDLKEVIYRCLEISQSKRISVQELRQTTYFRRIYQQLSKSKFQQSEQTQVTKRVNPLQRQNNDHNRYRSIERLYPSENGKPIKITFNNANSAFATAEKPFLGIHSNIPKPPQPSLPPPQLNLPPPSPSQNQRSSKMIHFARPFSTEKHIELSPPSLRARVLSIDHRKPVEKYKIFNPTLSFKIAVNILHYCRCLYHYLQLLIPNEPEKQLKFLSNWLILMLEQLKRKINDEEIVFEGSKRQIKMEKFREVRTDYERKYTNTLKKYLNNFISKPSLEEVKIFLFLQYRKFDFLLSKETKDCHLQIGVMSVLLYDSTRLLKKCQEENNFSRFANYKDLEEALLQTKEQFSLRTYSQIKKRILINA